MSKKTSPIGSTLPPPGRKEKLSASSKQAQAKKSVAGVQTNGNGHSADTADVLDHRELLRILIEVKNGNFSVRMPIDQVGVSGKICDTLNEIISINEKLMGELTRA